MPEKKNYKTNKTNKTSALVLLCYKLLCENDELVRENNELKERIKNLAERQSSPYWIACYHSGDDDKKK